MSFPDLQNEINGTFEIEVYDMTGKRIMSELLPENPSSVSLDMNPGFYIVKLLKNGNVIAVKELIKM